MCNATQIELLYVTSWIILYIAIFYKPFSLSPTQVPLKRHGPKAVSTHHDRSFSLTRSSTQTRVPI